MENLADNESMSNETYFLLTYILLGIVGIGAAILIAYAIVD